jgi:excisionase family DNA binding protein
MTSTVLIGSAEAAHLLGIDRATFNKWVARGDIKAHITYPGATGPRLFKRNEIERLAKQRGKGPRNLGRRVTDLAS